MVRLCLSGHFPASLFDCMSDLSRKTAVLTSGSLKRTSSVASVTGDASSPSRSPELSKGEQATIMCLKAYALLAFVGNSHSNV